MRRRIRRSVAGALFVIMVFAPWKDACGADDLRAAELDSPVTSSDAVTESLVLEEIDVLTGPNPGDESVDLDEDAGPEAGEESGIEGQSGTLREPVAESVTEDDEADVLIQRIAELREFIELVRETRTSYLQRLDANARDTARLTDQVLALAGNPDNRWSVSGYDGNDQAVWIRRPRVGDLERAGYNREATQLTVVAWGVDSTQNFIRDALVTGPVLDGRQLEPDIIRAANSGISRYQAALAALTAGRRADYLSNLRIGEVAERRARTGLVETVGLMGELVAGRVRLSQLVTLFRAFLETPAGRRDREALQASYRTINARYRDRLTAIRRLTATQIAAIGR